MAKEKKSALEIIVKDSKTQTSYVGDGSFLLMMFQKNEDEEDKGRIFTKFRANYNQQAEIESLFLSLLNMIKTMIGKRPYLMELVMKWLDGKFGDELFKEPPQEPTAKVEDPTSGTEPKAESCAPKIEEAKQQPTSQPQGEGEPAQESAANG